MILSSPGEVAFHIFNFPVYYYGIIMAFAILAGIFTAWALYKKYYGTKNAERIFDLSPLAILVGIIGARLYYCLLNAPYYMAHPEQIFDIRQGGLSVHGMFIIGLLALWGFSKFYKMSFPKLLDVFACGVALSQSIGRWGNFFNSEAFGKPVSADWPIKLTIPLDKRPFQYLTKEYFHPTFLYESVLDFAIFLLLLFFFKRFSKTPGITACCYFIMYSVVRIFVEELRIDSALNVGGFPIAQIVSAIIIFISAIFAIQLIERKHYD